MDELLASLADSNSPGTRRISTSIQWRLNNILFSAPLLYRATNPSERSIICGIEMESHPDSAGL